MQLCALGIIFLLLQFAHGQAPLEPAPEQAPLGPPSSTTRCYELLSLMMSSNSGVINPIVDAQGFLERFVAQIFTRISQDSATFAGKTSIFRYFNGSNGYPNIFSDSTNRTIQTSKWISWFSGYFGCYDTIPGPASNLSLSESHAHLAISRSDARLFNTRTMLAFLDILYSQNVDLTAGAAQSYVITMSSNLDALIPTYAVESSSIFCAKYSNAVADAGLSSDISNLATYGIVDYTSIFGTSNLQTEYQANMAKLGPQYALWFYFMKHAFILGEIAGNITVNQNLGKYFNGGRGTVNYLSNNAVALESLINKLTGWFGRAFGCTDKEFLPWAQSIGVVSLASNPTPVNLAISHDILQISKPDADLFNTAFLRQLTIALTPNGANSSDLSWVASVLDSVTFSIVAAPAVQSSPKTVTSFIPSAPSGGISTNPSATPINSEIPILGIGVSVGSIVLGTILVAVAVVLIRGKRRLNSMKKPPPSVIAHPIREPDPKGDAEIPTVVDASSSHSSSDASELAQQAVSPPSNEIPPPSVDRELPSNQTGKQTNEVEMTTAGLKHDGQTKNTMIPDPPAKQDGSTLNAATKRKKVDRVETIARTKSNAKLKEQGSSRVVNQALVQAAQEGITNGSTWKTDIMSAYAAEYSGTSVSVRVLRNAREQYAKLPELQGLLVDRLRRASLLSHPSIEKIHGTFTLPDQSVCFITNAFPNDSLSKMIETHTPFDPSQAKKVLKEILIALNFLHNAKGMTHGELTADKIQMSSTGKLLVCEVGVRTRALFDPESSDESIQMAPELRHNQKNLQPAVDVWSIGILCIEMHVGLLETQLEKLPDFDIIADDDLRSLVTSCLNADPKQRPSVRDLLDVL